jgi:hypothetical protein
MSEIATEADPVDTFTPEGDTMKKMRIAVLIATCVGIAAGVTARYRFGFNHFGLSRLQSGSAHLVRLNWTPSPSLNATGYYVYRSEASGSGYRRLNANPVKGLSYTDSSAEAGHTYYYVATTVDRTGNESKYSMEFKIRVP